MRVYNVGSPDQPPPHFDWDGMTYVVHPIGARYVRVPVPDRAPRWVKIPGSETNTVNFVDLPRAARAVINSGRIQREWGAVLKTEYDVKEAMALKVETANAVLLEKAKELEAAEARLSALAKLEAEIQARLGVAVPAAEVTNPAAPPIPPPMAPVEDAPEAGFEGGIPVRRPKK